MIWGSLASMLQTWTNINLCSFMNCSLLISYTDLRNKEKAMVPQGVRLYVADILSLKRSKKIKKENNSNIYFFSLF